jgi:uncharacterized protein (UPF0335 family)
MSGNFAKEQLKSIVERVERLEEEKKAISDDIKEVYLEAKANGFDAKVIKEIIKLRKMDATERAEYEAMLDLYTEALGMGGTPLWDAAREPEPTTISERAAAAAKPRKGSVAQALSAMGTPVPLTEDEKAKGVAAAWVGKDGTRVSIAAGGAARQPVPDHDPATGELLDPIGTAGNVMRDVHDNPAAAAEGFAKDQWAT